MSVMDLGALYLLGGVVCAVCVWRRGPEHRSASTALASLLLWPLWAPFALSSNKPRRERAVHRPKPASPRDGKLVSSLLAAIDDAVDVARDTPFETMLSEKASERIADEVRAACERLDELDALLSDPDFDPEAARERLTKLDTNGASTATCGAARMHLSNVERLRELHRSQTAALRELEEALAALRSQLVVAHYAGSTREGVGAIVSELWARVEGLGEALEPESEAALFDTDEQPPAPLQTQPTC